MMSRDPVGIDPSALEDSFLRLEPAGSRAEDSLEQFLISPTNAIETHNIGGIVQRKHPENLDVALLVGAPPPPPETPPPKKIRRRTPRYNNVKAGATPKMTNVGSFASIDEDSLLQSLATSSLKSIEPDSPTENGEKTLHTRNTSGSLSPDSVKVDIPPAQANKDKHPASVTLKIVEERVKAAMALYESDELVLDDSEEVTHEILRPAMAIIENKLEVLAVPTDHEISPMKEKIHRSDAPSDSPSQPPQKTSQKIPTIPNSEVTKSHSNKTRHSKPLLNAKSGLSNISESSKEAGSPRILGGQELHHPDRLRRASSVERQHKMPNEEKQKRDQKRGFFKKLFRGRTNSRGDIPKSRDSSPTVPASPRSKASPRSRSSPRSVSSPRSRSKSSPRMMVSPRSRSKSSPRRSPSPRAISVSSTRSIASARKAKDPAIDKRQRLVKATSPSISSSNTSRLQRHLKPTLKSEVDRQYQGPTLEGEVELKTDLMVAKPIELPPTPVSNRLSSNPASRAETVEPSAFSYSQDPPDDEHGDPPEFSGRPVLSPTSYNNLRINTAKDEDEVSRVESVKSRIAELYEERIQVCEEGPDDEGPLSQLPSTLSQDRNDYFFVQDEVSALTGTFGSKSFDPSGSGSHEEHVPEQSITSPHNSTDEGQHKYVDPYTVSKVPDDASLPTPAHASNLRVHIHGPSQDPAGASPMKWHYRGHPLMEPGFRDPVGESPIHVLRKINHEDDLNDPPLTASFVVDDGNDDPATHEEKKEVLLEPAISSSSSSNSETPFEKDFLVESTQKAESKNTSSTRVSLADLKLTHSTDFNAIKESVVSIPHKKKQKETPRKVAESPMTHHTKAHMELQSRSTAKSSRNSVTKGISPSKKMEEHKESRTKIEVDKAGFKSASNTPVSGHKALTITTAAFTNAKAVAYLHHLRGEPSPRHTWHASKRKQSNLSPLAVQAKTRKASGKTKITAAPGSHKKPSPDEYGAHNFNESQLVACSKMTAKVHNFSAEAHVVKTKEGALFSAYNAKFQGRKPSRKKVPKVETPTGIRLSLSSRGRPDFDPQDERNTQSVVLMQVKPGKITGWAVAKGIQLRRSKRDDNVANGKSARVVITPRKKTEGRNRFKFVPHNEDEIKDPIQRAGRRLLSKAAIPIQCAVRRYIARREAIDRMWALIEIQSYCRRWRSETNLQASIHSAVQMQSAFRGWLAREQLKDMRCAATQIQKVLRGYLCQARVYDTMYYIVRIQALLKGCYERKVQQLKKIAAVEIQKYLRGFHARLQERRNRRAIPIQALYRGHKARQEYAISSASVKLIQATWRAYSARLAFQFEIVDIIIVQSIVRRWAGCRYAKTLMYIKLFGPASIIAATWRGHTARKAYKTNFAARKLQTLWRGHTARKAYKKSFAARKLQTLWRGHTASKEYKKNLAARKIQTVWRGHTTSKEYKKNLAAKKIQTVWRGYRASKEYKKNIAARKIQTLWRGFQCYTDYIFSLVDVLVVQRTARQWLAKRRANEIRKENAAVKVQSCWRRHKARVMLLFSLVHIIIAQSVARRYLARFLVHKRRSQLKALQDAEQQRQNAATAIQKIWRGFLGFSHYIIMQYEIARLQAIIRGKLARQSYNLKLGCAIIIQANIRRHLAKDIIGKKLVVEAISESAGLALRERNAAKRIQFWWRIVLDWTREKKAALTIERFFIRVREEVDREIMRRERRKMMKKEKRRQKRRESDEQMLERAWLNTVDENTAVGNYSRDSQVSETDSRSKSAPRLREGSQSTIPDVQRRIPSLGAADNGLLSPKPSNVGQEVDINGWPIQRVDSSCSRSRPPTDSVRMSSSEDNSEVSNITNPTVFNRMGQPPGRYEGHGRTARDKRMSTDDYIKKYGGDNGLQTVPNRLPSTDNTQHFFSDSGSLGSSKEERAVVTRLPIIIPPHSQVHTLSIPGTPTTRSRSSSAPRPQIALPAPHGVSSSSNTHATRSKSSSTTPRNNFPAGIPSTPRSTASSHQVPSPRIQVGFPPATPRSHKISNKMHISRRETAETESHTTYSQNSFTKTSPRSRSDGNVMLMKSYPNFLKSHSNDDGQEVLYLGGADFGDEYGEV